MLNYPVLQLRAAAHTHGCTINDLLIAAATAGLRDLLRSRGECRDGLLQHASVPVGAQQGSAGGMFIASLPVGVPDKAERLQIMRQANFCRQGSPNQGVAGHRGATSQFGASRCGVGQASRDDTCINLYATNVPGPTSALYLAGARLLEAVPLAPLVAGVKLSVTAVLQRSVCGVPARRRQHFGPVRSGRRRAHHLRGLSRRVRLGLGDLMQFSRDVPRARYSSSVTRRPSGCVTYQS